MMKLLVILFIMKLIAQINISTMTHYRLLHIVIIQSISESLSIKKARYNKKKRGFKPWYMNSCQSQRFQYNLLNNGRENSNHN